MMLRSCGGSLTEVKFSAQASVSSSSSSKLHNLCSTSNSKLFLGFNSHKNPLNLKDCLKNIRVPHAQKKIQGKDGVLLGFKLQCRSKNAALPNKSVYKGKKKKYGGVLPSILRALEGGIDVEGILESYCGKLNPREQTVILKEQRRWDKVVRVFEWFKSQEDYVPNVILPPSHDKCP